MVGPWVVLKQETRVARLADGTFGDAIRVTFRTAGGAVAFVDVPAVTYTADTARDAIDRLAAELDALNPS